MSTAHHPYAPHLHALITAAGAGLLLVLTAASPAIAQAHVQNTGIVQGNRENAANRAADQRARLLGALVYNELSVEFDATPAREAFAALAEAIDIPVIVRWADPDRGRNGIDPEAPIMLDISEQSAIDVLEDMIEQCEVFEACTWQIRRSYVEVGTKSRLSVPAAREVRIYPINDLLVEPPYFASALDSTNGAGSGPGITLHTRYASAVIDSGGNRKKPEEAAEELIKLICETVEPGAWDYGQGTPEETDDDPPAGISPYTQPKSSPSSKRRDGHLPRISGPAAGTIASIRYWRGQLIIRAPDYIHRQINGYPQPIRPDGDPPSSGQQPDEQESD